MWRLKYIKWIPTKTFNHPAYTKTLMLLSKFIRAKDSRTSSWFVWMRIQTHGIFSEEILEWIQPKTTLVIV